MIFQYNIFYFLYYYQKDLILEKSNDTFQYLKYILGKYYINNMTTSIVSSSLNGINATNYAQLYFKTAAATSDTLATIANISNTFDIYYGGTYVTSS